VNVSVVGEFVGVDVGVFVAVDVGVDGMVLPKAIETVAVSVA
jgi:hypothetical protein